MGKTSWGHIKIRYIWAKPLIVYKKTISMGKNIDVILKIRYLCEKPLMSYRIRYLLEKPSMSYKNTLSIGKNIGSHVKIQYLCEKPLMSDKISVGKTHWCPLNKYDIIWAKPLMSYKNSISLGKTIDVLKDIYQKNHWCHIKIRIYMWKTSKCHRKIRYICAKPLRSYQIRYLWGKTIDFI